ncbi:ubiquitin-conjugating enzyme E2 [Nostoc sp.]|uniref:ubiquitin-conjugating enzyme E2 n=1 Tax=Nostoc sp. TaxID=1180 RepID=UPI002FF645B1
MTLTLKDLIKHGILNEFSALFHNETMANLVLDLIDFPTGMRPQFPTNDSTLGYWRKICQQITNGILPEGTDLQALIDEAAELYQSNPVFSQYRSDRSESTQPNNQLSHTTQAQQASNNNLFTVLIRGRDDATNVLASAGVIAPGQNISTENITLRFSGNGVVLLGLNNCSSQAIASFAGGLQTILQSGQNQVQVSVLTEDPQPYLISRIFVEGPDQARFEVSDVSSDTTVGEIAKGVMSEAYDPRMFQDSRGRGRRVVVDRVSEDGSTERLAHDQTLHEANIQEDDTLSVAPEATAGAIHPQLRQEALARARNQIMAYAQTHLGFQVSANSHLVPTDYLLKFNAPGFAPPLQPGGEPQVIDEHEVYLALPGTFPMQAPQAFWQTPIYHPNIELKTGLVCLGDLGDRYRPGLDFAKLCQLLIDIASYQNYAVEEGYNKEAQEWVISDQGQVAIEQRGGQSVLRKLFNEVQTPPKLNIKRLSE